MARQFGRGGGPLSAEALTGLKSYRYVVSNIAGQRWLLHTHTAAARAVGCMQVNHTHAPTPTHLSPR